MKIIWILLVLSSLLLAGCVKIEVSPEVKLSECEQLKNEFDKKVDYRGFLMEYEGIVGGTLTKIEDIEWTPDESVTDSYRLTFVGNQKTGELVFITTPGVEFVYMTGKFYKFDLSNTRRSGMLSGAFIDKNFDTFEEMDC